jgi:hypothetical protein
MITLEQTASLVELQVLQPGDAVPIGSLLLSYGDFEEYASFTASDVRIEEQYGVLRLWLSKRHPLNGSIGVTEALSHVVAYLSSLLISQGMTSREFLQRLAPIIWSNWDQADNHAKQLYALWAEWDDLDADIQRKELTSALSFDDQHASG